MTAAPQHVAPPDRPRRRFRLASRGSVKRLAALALLIGLVLVYLYRAMIHMPGSSYRGVLGPLTIEQQSLATRLRADVERLDGDMGGRSLFYPRRLAEAAVFLDDSLKAAGYATTTYSFTVRGTACPNIEVVVPGRSRPDEVVVIGAHYDAFQGSPAADDNASGVAGVLALARHFHDHPADRTLRFVLFVNEEPPSFMTEDMGSLVYARACRARSDRIVAMLSLETIGYFSETEGSQQYPPPLGQLYPSRGDFIAFVGNYGSRRLVRDSLAAFRASEKFPSEGAALFEGIPGVGWSDHWSFWQCGYPALMVTDTAPFRNPNYHTAADTPDTLDYGRMARVVTGLRGVVECLGNR